MKNIFVNTTLLDKDAYQEFNAFHSRPGKILKAMWLVYSLLLLLMVLSILLDKESLQDKMRNFTPLLFFMLVLIPGMWKHRKLSSSCFLKRYNGMSFPLYLENSFGDDSFTVSGDKFFFQNKYENLYKVYETDKYFYLYFNKSAAYILSKDGFSMGIPIQFSFFMREKMGDNFIAKVKHKK